MKKESFGIKSGNHSSIEKIEYSNDYKRHQKFWKIFRLIIMLCVLLISALIIYISITGPIETNSGYIYPSQYPPKNGQKVVVLPEENNFSGHLIMGLYKQQVSYGHVIVGNYGTLTDTGGKYTVVQNNKNYVTNVKVIPTHGAYLNNEYVVKYTGGAAKKGSEAIVKGANVQLLK